MGVFPALQQEPEAPQLALVYKLRQDQVTVEPLIGVN